MQKVYKTLLKAEPERAREQLEDLAVRLSPRDYAACERLRAVAEELIRRGLEVTAVDYQDGSQELEVVHPQARHVGPVTVDRDASGTGCQLSWEEWVDVADEAGVARTADTVTALLLGVGTAVKP
jgi:hypothetical protein